jgi:hypothetical protein
VSWPRPWPASCRRTWRTRSNCCIRPPASPFALVEKHPERRAPQPRQQLALLVESVGVAQCAFHHILHEVFGIEGRRTPSDEPLEKRPHFGHMLEQPLLQRAIAVGSGQTRVHISPYRTEPQ